MDKNSGEMAMDRDRDIRPFAARLISLIEFAVRDATDIRANWLSESQLPICCEKINQSEAKRNVEEYKQSAR